MYVCKTAEQFCSGPVLNERLTAESCGVSGIKLRESCSIFDHSRIHTHTLYPCVRGPGSVRPVKTGTEKYRCRLMVWGQDQLLPQLVQFISMLDAFARKTHLKPRGSALIE